MLSVFTSFDCQPLHCFSMLPGIKTFYPPMKQAWLRQMAEMFFCEGKAEGHNELVRHGRSEHFGSEDSNHITFPFVL